MHQYYESKLFDALHQIYSIYGVWKCNDLLHYMRQIYIQYGSTYQCHLTTTNVGVTHTRPIIT